MPAFETLPSTNERPSPEAAPEYVVPPRVRIDSIGERVYDIDDASVLAKPMGNAALVLSRYYAIAEREAAVSYGTWH